MTAEREPRTERRRPGQQQSARGDWTALSADLDVRWDAFELEVLEWAVVVPWNPDRLPFIMDRFRRSIEEQAAAEARRGLREWVESRNASAWSPGWSDDFKRGYDTAVEEVESRL